MSGKLPTMPSANEPSGKGSSRADVAAFADALRSVASVTSQQGTGRAPSGRVMFGLDATLSRQPTWDVAISLQAEMFRAAADVGGIETQLVFFRGTNECKATDWERDPAELARKMSKVTVQGGRTQIARVLDHAVKQHATKRLTALVYIGDAVEEPVDDLCARAGQLGLSGVRGFFFYEGHDPHTKTVFEEMGRLMTGAAFHFEAGSAERLRGLLAAIAAWAAGGQPALKALANGSARDRGKSEGAQQLLRFMGSQK